MITTGRVVAYSSADNLALSLVTLPHWWGAPERAGSPNHWDVLPTYRPCIAGTHTNRELCEGVGNLSFRRFNARFDLNTARTSAQKYAKQTASFALFTSFSVCLPSHDSWIIREQSGSNAALRSIPRSIKYMSGISVLQKYTRLLWFIYGRWWANSKYSVGEGPCKADIVGRRTNLLLYNF